MTHHSLRSLQMALLTVASKTNAAYLLPVVTAANYVQVSTPDAGLNIAFEDEESVGAQKGKLELKLADGKLVYDDDVLPYLRDNYQALQLGNKDQVCSDAGKLRR